MSFFTRLLVLVAILAAGTSQAAQIKSARNIAGTSTPAAWSLAANGQIQVQPFAQDAAAQCFVIAKGTSAGYYSIRTCGTGQCVGVRFGAVQSPAEVLQARACSGNQGDDWTLRRLAGATAFKIQSRLGAVIAGTQTSPAAGSVVDMWTDEASDTQDWTAVEFVNRARPADTAVRTRTGKAYNAPLSGATVLPSAEADLTDCAGLLCKVAGSSPARYATAKQIAPGMSTADLVDALAITEASPPVNVTVATPASVRGSAIENQTLTATAATFSNYTGTVGAEWLRGTTVVGTGLTYQVQTADIGSAITFRSTAGSVTSTATTGVVVAASGSSTWAGGTVTAPFTGLATSGPITVTASNTVIEGKSISNPTGNCIRIAAGVTNVTIRGNNIGPCGRSTNTDDYGGGGFGVYALAGSTATTVQGNYIADTAGCIRLSSAHPNIVDRNRCVSIRGARNAQGNSYIAGIQLASVPNVGTTRSKVTCNVLDANEWTNTVTTATPGIEDGVNLNGTGFTTVAFNWFRGGSHGYTSATGSAVALGDDGGSNNQARKNVALNTPNHGFFTAGGINNLVEDNLCYNPGGAGTNTSLCFAAAGFQGQVGHDQLFRNNRGWSAYWKDGSGSAQTSSFFSPVPGRDSGANPVTALALTGNNFADTTLSSSIWGTTRPECSGTAAVNDGTIAFPQVAQTIPLQSTITGRTVPYPRFTPAPFQGRTIYEVFGNNWTANSNNGNNTLQAAAGSWSQSVGVSALQENYSVNFRLKWSYPQQYSGQEVLNYPGIVTGRGATTSASTPQAGAKLPMQISAITSLRTGYASAAGPMSGLGHLSYDLWASDTPTSTFPEGTKGTANYIQHRLAEIMLPRRIVGGYGVPNSPPAAAAGRGCVNVGQAGTNCWGRNPNIYIERTTIGGVLYDVYRAPPNSQYTGLEWNFIVFQPLTTPGTGGDVVEWKPLLDYIAGKGWITNFNSQYLNAVELGVEAINPNTYDLATGGSTGDIQVMGFWTEVNGARY